MTADREIRIEVPVLARVEGEGALEIRASEGKIERLRLRIFEPPRYFEKLLEGRDSDEVIDIVARICGICPVAYQLTAALALEKALGLTTGARVRALRRLLYCGEWLQSHALHIHLLALPDFLGFDSTLAMADEYPQTVRRGLRLQRLGNDLIRWFGGRSVHPVGVRIGGFYREPDPCDRADLRRRLEEALHDAEVLVQEVAGLDLPNIEQSFQSVSLRQPDEYPIDRGRIVSDRGLDIDVAAFDSCFVETHEKHSTALVARLNGQPYLVGPLARMNNNLDTLPAATRAVLEQTGISWPSRNLFHSIVARAVEIHLVIMEALRILDGFSRLDPEPPAASREFSEPIAQEGLAEPRKADDERLGVAATEAPRGMLWHHYRLDQDGRVLQARMVPPTAQNQARMEEDLRLSLEQMGLHHPDDALRQLGEQVIRNYDPCISCATHFLRVDVQRSIAP